ncbi:MAG: zinc ribbon domain-containing protein [Acidobacteriota bacterium]
MTSIDPNPSPANTDPSRGLLGRLSAIDAAIRGGEHVVSHCRARLATPQPVGRSATPAEREALETDLLSALARNAERQAQRRALLAEMDATLRLAYEEIHGRGLVPAVIQFDGNGACGGCHLRVPPQRQVELRKRGALACPHCGRILFVAPGERAASPDAGRRSRPREREA